MDEVTAISITVLDVDVPECGECNGALADARRAEHYHRGGPDLEHLLHESPDFLLPTDDGAPPGRW
jgi:hypothetical protein